MTHSTNRRPLRTRSKAWVGQFTTVLLKTGITPNQISLLSVIFGVLGAFAFTLSPQNSSLFIVASVCIQLRLCANMMDGLVAIEGGKSTANGELYNEIPDRFTDVLFLAAAGFATGHPAGQLAGWLSACGALITAYIRLHGAALNTGNHDFSGPFAKPQRMFALTIATLATFVTADTRILLGGLWIIAIGTFVTFVRRTARLSRQLNERSTS